MVAKMVKSQRHKEEKKGRRGEQKRKKRRERARMGIDPELRRLVRRDVGCHSCAH